MDPVSPRAGRAKPGSGAEIDVVDLARSLIDIESTTGNEGAVAAFLAAFLRDRGYSVLEQPLADIRLKADTTSDAAVAGDIRLKAGTTSDAAVAGDIRLKAGTTTDAAVAGDIRLKPGTTSDAAVGGDIRLKPGTTSDAAVAGDIRLQAGTTSDAAAAGDIRLKANTTRDPVVSGFSRIDTKPRFNVIAAVGEPKVVFSTHFDCVPPFFPSRIEDGMLYGRGSCDAKGILAAQIAAAERLRANGETRIGLVFVGGEERGSDGAKAANRIASKAKFLINGEPTDLRLGAATRGAYRVRLTAQGKAAHSGYPELGESAIDKLIDCLVALRDAEWPSDPLLGLTHHTVGLIHGGVAPNVVSPHAEAEVFFRTVGDHAPVRETLHRALAGRVQVEEILELPAVRMHTVAGFETATFSYFSDIPFLSNWGTPLLIGPGSIHVAHTGREHVAIAELDRAVGIYEKLAATLLSS